MMNYLKTMQRYSFEWNYPQLEVVLGAQLLFDGQAG
jgi:hypothetical protein